MSRLADIRFMDAALALAFQALGSTAPNPAVGCVIVKDGRIAGAGSTAPGGRPHAERIALDEAGAAARGADVYVTLEPCAHHGATPPCADALIAARPARVVIACLDPFALVDGRGRARLRQAGIAVETGLREAEARALNAGFFHKVATGEPLLVFDRRSALFDAEFAPEPGESETAALKRLGAAGFTRVNAPGRAPETGC